MTTIPPQATTNVKTRHEATAKTPRSECGGMLRRVALVCFLGLVLVFSRTVWLPLVAYPLLAPAPKHLDEVTQVWVHTEDGQTLSGDGVIQQTADLLKSRPNAGVILTVGWPSRLVEIGVIPPPIEILRKALSAYQIDPDRIIELEVPGFQFWNEARAMDTYLSQHPQERVVFLTEEFAGRSQELILRTVMDPRNRDRVEILGLSDPRYSHHNWWKCRAGVKAVMVGYLYLIHTMLQPHPGEPPKRLSVKDFEEAIPDLPGTKQ